MSEQFAYIMDDEGLSFTSLGRWIDNAVEDIANSINIDEPYEFDLGYADDEYFQGFYYIRSSIHEVKNLGDINSLGIIVSTDFVDLNGGLPFESAEHFRSELRKSICDQFRNYAYANEDALIEYIQDWMGDFDFESADEETAKAINVLVMKEVDRIREALEDVS